MKNLLSTLLILLSINIYSQSTRIEDPQNQLQKEDPDNLYNQENISKLDLIEALELASIGIHKFNIGEFEREYKLQIFAEEYVNGKNIITDTLLDYTNDYDFVVDDEFHQGFIDQIKIFTKTEENNSTLDIRTYALSSKSQINLAKNDHRQFYTWRQYSDTTWELNKKIPLLIFASSWLDKKYNFHRFCGVVKLKDNDKQTNELLNSSPNYIVISYKITE
ncbi:hypothetical protein GCM10023115_24930 [Pontixanthobacter gangjinensis]|uniref:DUF5041 domain-containing protein n=1 Tax=Christiangramia aestuarii TaxID=1028746 RepID=A0A7K1LSZ4_9FLAO|nr:DUF5041 domain-containing protein [Christiangramia aestuarii]MUP43923.1 DUF5041 domain-containing protein [Christiangramia aestuarii]